MVGEPDSVRKNLCYSLAAHILRDEPQTIESVDFITELADHIKSSIDEWLMAHGRGGK